MIKKLLVLAAGVVFSLHAHAGYVQYYLGGRLTGYLIQNDATNRIVGYSFLLFIPNVNPPFGQNIGYGGVVGTSPGGLVSISTYFPDGGPTNFTLFEDTPGLVVSLDANFASAENGDYTYAGNFSALLTSGSLVQESSGALSGTARLGDPVPSFMVDFLDQHGGANGLPVPYINPAEVPEPASLGLVGLGALGIAALRRRQKV